jgi:hypothetical protein
MALEQNEIEQFQLYENQSVRSVDHIRQRINRYDAFLKNNIKELHAKGYQMPETMS